MTERLTLPVLPLRDVVLFPGVTAPIGAGRPGTLRAIEAALAHARASWSSRSPSARTSRTSRPKCSTPSAPSPGSASCSAACPACSSCCTASGGASRSTYARRTATSRPSSARRRSCCRSTRRIRPSSRCIARRGPAPPSWARSPACPRRWSSRCSPASTSRAASPTSSPATSTSRPAQRQELLETLSVEERLRRVLVHVQRQIGVLDAQEDIKSQVQEELGERQREMFLREQLKHIRRELGEEDEARASSRSCEQKLAALELPEEARKEVDRELGRLARIGRESMESQVIRTYLENVAELPWNDADRGPPRPARSARQILDEDHYALATSRTGCSSSWPSGSCQQEAGEHAGRRKRAEAGPAAAAAEDGGEVPPVRPSIPGNADDKAPRARSCCSSARPASARPRSPSPSPGRWGASTSASRSAARGTRPTSAAIGGPTSAPCRAGSSRA